MRNGLLPCPGGPLLHARAARLGARIELRSPVPYLTRSVPRTGFPLARRDRGRSSRPRGGGGRARTSRSASARRPTTGPGCGVPRAAGRRLAALGRRMWMTRTPGVGWPRGRGAGGRRGPGGSDGFRGEGLAISRHAGADGTAPMRRWCPAGISLVAGQVAERPAGFVVGQHGRHRAHQRGQDGRVRDPAGERLAGEDRGGVAEEAEPDAALIPPAAPGPSHGPQLTATICTSRPSPLT